MGERVVFGVRPEWATAPIINVPAGARVLRRRFRSRGLGEAFVVHNGTVSQHVLGLTPLNELKLLPAKGLNKKEANNGLA